MPAPAAVARPSVASSATVTATPRRARPKATAAPAMPAPTTTARSGPLIAPACPTDLAGGCPVQPPRASAGSMVRPVRVTGEDLSLHVAEDGDRSAPPVLLVHGIIGSRATWGWLVPELSERFRVLRLDLRGHGLSDRAPGRYTAEGYVADAVAALEHVAARPCVVVGHSLGGATAAAIAQRRPDLLTGV